MAKVRQAAISDSGAEKALEAKQNPTEGQERARRKGKAQGLNPAPLHQRNHHVPNSSPPRHPHPDKSSPTRTQPRQYFHTLDQQIAIYKPTNKQTSPTPKDLA